MPQGTSPSISSDDPSIVNDQSVYDEEPAQPLLKEHPPRIIFDPPSEVDVIRSAYLQQNLHLLYQPVPQTVRGVSRTLVYSHPPDCACVNVWIKGLASGGGDRYAVYKLTSMPLHSRVSKH